MPTFDDEVATILEELERNERRSGELSDELAAMSKETMRRARQDDALPDLAALYTGLACVDAVASVWMSASRMMAFSLGAEIEVMAAIQANYGWAYELEGNNGV